MHRLQQAQWLDVAKRAVAKNERIAPPELSSIALFPGAGPLLVNALGLQVLRLWTLLMFVWWPSLQRKRREGSSRILAQTVDRRLSRNTSFSP